MSSLDWVVIIFVLLVSIIIGIFGWSKTSTSADYYTASGRLPWWLSGISHHVSGYSGAVFVAYAGVAYTHGFTVYIWWAFMIAVAILAGSYMIAPRWAQLRSATDIQSPTEYLKRRYDLRTQQIIAWGGVFVKVFDVAAKWAAIAILMYVFTGLPFVYGVLLVGSVCLVYITIGGLWADVWTDFVQFFVQLLAGIAMFVFVLRELNGIESVVTIWSELPEMNHQLFNEPYSFGFAVAFLIIYFFSYNGGTWNLATRYISSPTGSSARKAALLSSALYLVWPLLLFFPMWAAPILLPELEDPSHSYAELAQSLLPSGMVGLVLASLFASTMSMTSSDANTISAVITRDILPGISDKYSFDDSHSSLVIARTATASFTLVTLLIAIFAESFGGVLGLIVYWFGALMGPFAVPVILGLLPQFTFCDSRAAIVSILGGILAFVAVNVMPTVSETVQILAPITVSFVLFTGTGWFSKTVRLPEGVQTLMEEILVVSNRENR